VTTRLCDQEVARLGNRVMSPTPIISVDIGNARLKLGLFAPPLGPSLPEPRSILRLDDTSLDMSPLVQWLRRMSDELQQDGQPLDKFSWWIGSVNRDVASRLVTWLRDHRPNDRVMMLAANDLPLAIELPHPDRVGIDRLLDAVAVNRVRAPRRPAVIVDVGTAITVDLVSSGGAFLGGSILPGIAMSARALHEFTDLLPLIEMSQLESRPPVLGTETVAAMRSGLFWGALGAIREITNRLAEGQPPAIFLTGGAGPAVAQLLGHGARHVPHLTLAGIALSVLSPQQP